MRMRRRPAVVDGVLANRWPSCDCAEGFVVKVARDGTPLGRERIMVARPHDCLYIEQRNALIPQAVKLADSARREKGVNWSQAFMGYMDTLASVQIYGRRPLPISLN